jgi:HK97 family phage major capsid protein
MTDTSMGALTKSINTIGVAFEEFKSTNDEIISALKAGKESLANELNQKLGRIEADLKAATSAKSEIEKEQTFLRERLEDLESKKSAPGKSAQEKLSDEYKSTLMDWIRQKGNSPMLEQKLYDLQRKDVTVGSAAGGGYAVPEMIAREIGLLVQK